MRARRGMGDAGAGRQQRTGRQQHIADALGPCLGVDDILVVLALAAQPACPARHDHHMHGIESPAPALEIGAHQKPEEIEGDGRNLQIVERKQRSGCVFRLRHRKGVQTAGQCGS